MVDEPARSDAGSWVVIEPEIRATCSKPATWIAVVAANTDTDGSNERSFQVADRQVSDCDPCPIGEWTMDLNSAESFFRNLGPDGAGLNTSITGLWTVSFLADQGSLAINDNLNLGVRVLGRDVTVTGGGAGNLRADEEFLTISFYQASAEAALFDMTQTASGTGSPTFSYKCEGNVLSFVSNDTEIMLNRVDPAVGDPYF